MIFAAFCLFSFLLVLVSVRSLIDGVKYLRFFRTELAAGPKPVSAFAAVIAPCRGLDQGFEANVAAVLSQDQAEYEVIFVVDDPDDPAAAVIRHLIADKPFARLLIAGKAFDSSQKVENLREAVLHISDRTEVIVFVDSDARPGPKWLASLIRPLADDSIGAATGYRWFVPPSGSLASRLRSAWNASIASALGPNVSSNFCWGGSMAIRRDVFERLSVRERWRGTLSDDFVVTMAVKEAGLGIAFVPEALAASLDDCSIGELLEFTTRQLKITRVYSPNHWIISFIGSALFTGVLTTSAVLILLPQAAWLTKLVAAGTILSVSLLSAAKAWVRLEAVRLILNRYDDQLKRDRFVHIFLCLLTPFIFLYNCLRASFSRDLRWRGVTYRLKSPTETVIIRD